MRANRKGLVIAIIVLLVGASGISSIGEEIRESNSGKDFEKEKIMENFDSVPLFFTENKGQFPEEVLFQTHVSGATVYLCRDGVVSVFSREIKEESDDEHVMDSMYLESIEPPQMETLSISAKFVDANTDIIIVGEGLLPHYNNYFFGNDPDKWYTDVPNYISVWYKDIYPSIDLHYYGDGNSLKYDFIIYPGADPSVINIRYDGVEDVELTPAGDLQMQTRFGSVYEKMPVLYQEIDGAIQEVSGWYEIREPCVFGFAVDGSYNPLYPLVIDPQLVYSTYLGGIGYDLGCDIAVDDNGCAYVTGFTTAFDDFPTKNAYDDSLDDGSDCFVTKFSTLGDSLVYSTYLSGTRPDRGYGIAVDDNGCAYVTGQTSSSDFPTVNAYDDSLDGNSDCFVTKFSTLGDSLVYSTYLGGTNWDDGWGIAVDDSGCAYVTGATGSSDFPTVNAYDDSRNGNRDCFVTKFSSDMVPPEISDVTIIVSDPIDTEHGFGWENVTCTVIDTGIGVKDVKLNATYKTATVDYTMTNIPETDTYYYNTTFTVAGNYTYHVWADDLNGNTNTTVPELFALPLNEDVDMNGKAHFSDLMDILRMYAVYGPKGWVREDTDNNGQVHFDDLIEILRHYGERWT